MPHPPHSACILHATIHPVRADCLDAARHWEKDRDHLTGADLHHAYQAAVERLILNTLIRDLAPSAGLPARCTTEPWRPL
ncbi:hypothetical protein ACIPW9_35910 [Streptomyces sp. NPDC090052]|uniref:hypothetical protein n=1 Tax=Streptomyces sp. NPDC090052 TaxID=3365931 RepID=UPI0037F93FAD